MYRLETQTGAGGWPESKFQPGDPVPLGQTRRAGGIIASVISLAVLVVAVASLRRLDLHAVEALVPRRLDFWLVFLASYFVAPVADWVIFRRLWRTPLDGIVPLLRKLVGNELLLGYVGELYFYAWARRRADITTAPFGAIKDVTVLSALTGNVMTLVMLVAAWPMYRLLPLGSWGRPLIYSIAVMLVTSFAAFALRKRLFSLPPGALWFTTAVHLARIVLITGLTAVAWHLVLPQIALGWWLLLATLRLVISRLPLIANKEVVFAAVAAVLVGPAIQIADLMAMMASLVLAAHVTLGIALGATEFLQREATA